MKVNITRLFLLSIMLILFNHLSFAQTIDKEYSLAELINSAYQNNPQLKANSKNIQAGMKQIDYLEKDYLPQIFFDMNISRWEWLQPNKQKLLGNSLNDIYADLRINQLIYDWDKIKMQKEYSYQSLNIDRTFTRKLKQTFSFAISKYYLEFLKAKRTTQIEDEAISQLKEHLKNAEALYSIGKVSNLDVIKANIQIEVARDELAKAKNQLNIQRNKINVLCGNVLSDSFSIKDNIDELWDKYSNTSFNFEELKSELKKQHPDLENIKTQQELRKREADIFTKEYYPNIYAFGIANVEDSKIPMGNFNWNIGVTVSYSLPFFRGTNFQEKVEQSKLKNEALQENEKDIIQQLESQVKDNLLKYEDIKNRLNGSQKIVKLAEESLTTSNMKYNIGKGTSLDVLDAETVLTTSKLNYNQIVIDLLTNIAELNYTIGSDEMPLNK